jgi:hypothetical protein
MSSASKTIDLLENGELTLKVDDEAEFFETVSANDDESPGSDGRNKDLPGSCGRWHIP